VPADWAKAWPEKFNGTGNMWEDPQKSQDAAFTTTADRGKYPRTDFLVLRGMSGWKSPTTASTNAIVLTTSTTQATSSPAPSLTTARPLGAGEGQLLAAALNWLDGKSAKKIA
jgi:hypothetical protein